MVVHLIDACQVAARSPGQRPAARSVAASGPSWRTIWPRRSLRENIAVRRFQSEGGAMSEERRKAAWIGGSVLVKGDVVSHEDLVIDGQVQGTIELGDHSLVIGSGASVVADLVAKSVTISGKVTGNVIGVTRVELKS